MRLLLLLLFAGTYGQLLAQKQNIYYMQNNGRQLNKADSADYIRIISEPDSGSNFYNIKEYYNNLGPKLIGKTAFIEPLRFEGQVRSYFKNGRTKSVSTYNQGNITDSSYYKFPNGRIYMITYHPPAKPGSPEADNYYIAQQYDSSGHALITDGRGQYKGYNDDFTSIVEEGLVTGGKRNGSWKGNALNGRLSFTEEYNNNILTFATATDSSGKSYTYTKSRVNGPTINGSINNFYDAMAKTFRYPARARQNGVQGRVVVQFRVNTNGRVSDIQLLESAGEDLGREVLRVLPLLPKWTPATICGYPVEQYVVYPISFKLAGR